MKKRNVILVLVVVLIILGITFIISSFSENKQFISGLASPGAEDGEDCTCSGTPPGECMQNQPGFCEADGDDCSIILDCGVCGCPDDGICQESGSCSSDPQLSGSGGGSSGRNSNITISTCSIPAGESYTLDGCNNGRICLPSVPRGIPNPKGPIDGICVVSSDGDGICNVVGGETCELNFGDCNGEKADCLGDNACQELFPGAGFGQCSFLKAPDCEDGTPVGECSNIEGNYGSLCQIDNGTASLVHNSCNECANNIAYDKCPSGYSCLVDGSCSLGPLDFINDTNKNDTIIDEVGNYCELAGGTCSNSCGENYYELDEKEYSVLTDSCKTENKLVSTCCYPYSTDDTNDCEFIGGTCLVESCGEGYYSAGDSYLDSECETFSSNGNSICCLESNVPIDEESTGKGDRGFLGILLGGEGNKESTDKEPLKIGEYLSLNRDRFIGGTVLILIGVLVFLGLHFKIRKNKETKKKKVVKKRRKK